MMRNLFDAHTMRFGPLAGPLLLAVLGLLLAGSGCTGLQATRYPAGQGAESDGEGPGSNDTVTLYSVGNSQSFVGDVCDTERTVVEVTSKGRDAQERSAAAFGLRPDDEEGAAPDEWAGDLPTWLSKVAGYTKGDGTVRVQHSRTEADRCYVAEGGTQSPTNANWMERLGGFLLGLLMRGGGG